MTLISLLHHFPTAQETRPASAFPCFYHGHGQAEGLGHHKAHHTLVSTHSVIFLLSISLLAALICIISFPLAIYFTFGSVYMSMPLSHFIPAYPSPSPCPQVCSLHLPLYSCPAPMFFITIFFYLDSIYMCYRTVFVFLFLTHFTLYDRL